MEKSIFRSDAKQMVDMAFDNKLFKGDVTRDDMTAFEDLIDFLLSTRFESYKRAEALFDRIEKNRVNNAKEL